MDIDSIESCCAGVMSCRRSGITAKRDCGVLHARFAVRNVGLGVRIVPVIVRCYMHLSEMHKVKILACCLPSCHVTLLTQVSQAGHL